MLGERKVCKDCKIEKNVSDYYRHKGGKNGVRARCKDCNKIYEDKRKHERSEYAKWWRQKNRECRLRYEERYRNENRERLRTYAREYYYRNRNATVEPLSYRERSRYISPATRFEVLIRDSFRCQYCGASPRTSDGVELEVDHVIPFSAGGNSDIDNLLTACIACNRGKGKKLVEVSCCS